MQKTPQNPVRVTAEAFVLLTSTYAMIGFLAAHGLFANGGQVLSILCLMPLIAPFLHLLNHNQYTTEARTRTPERTASVGGVVAMITVFWVVIISDGTSNMYIVGLLATALAFLGALIAFWQDVNTVQNPYRLEHDPTHARITHTEGKPHVKRKRGAAHVTITGSGSQRTELIDLPAGRYKLQLWPPEGNALTLRGYDLHNQDQHDLATDIRDVHAGEVTLRRSRYEFSVELGDPHESQQWELTLEHVGD